MVIRDADEVQQQFVRELRALEESRQRRNQFHHRARDAQRRGLRSR
jgi:hypothetical protein